jgi:HAD superfamily hydrolase (TIGR01549 family)
MQWEAVFWDFDGVILDSVHVKTKAFAQMFQHYGPEVEKAVVDYHLEHGGISRYDKFRHYYQNILNLEITEEKLQELGQKFSDLVLQKVIASPFIAGALETLNALKAKGIPCYIVSGTPDDEIRHIVTVKGLAHFFQEVHGAPRKKSEILTEILQRQGYRPELCLFLGDAMSDYNAAQQTGVCFLGIIADGDSSPFPPGTNVSNIAKV